MRIKYEAVKVLGEVGYDGILILDHIPQMGHNSRLGRAYTIACMRALQKRGADELNN